MKESAKIRDRIQAKVSSVRDRMESMGLSGKSGAAILFDDEGNVKQECRIDNLVVDEGDDYLVDQLASAAIDAMDCMALGDGYTSLAKGDDWLTAGYAGNGHDTVNEGGLDAGFPKIKPGGGNENILQYQATFEAGYATKNGIDEAIVSNVNPDGSGGDPGSSTILAHGQITPEVNKGASDSLVLVWEVAFLGA